MKIKMKSCTKLNERQSRPWIIIWKNSKNAVIVSGVYLLWNNKIKCNRKIWMGKTVEMNIYLHHEWWWRVKETKEKRRKINKNVSSVRIENLWISTKSGIPLVWAEKWRWRREKSGHNIMNIKYILFELKENDGTQNLNHASK